MNQIEVYTHPDGTHDFRIKDADNHKILCSSRQGYVNMTDCIDTAQSVTRDQTLPEILFSREAE